MESKEGGGGAVAADSTDQARDSQRALQLNTLRSRCQSTLMPNGELVGEVIDASDSVTGGDVGRFTPRTHTHSGKNEILLVGSPRRTEEILLTLCHELGHFWAHFSGRRGPDFLGDMNGRLRTPNVRFQVWWKDIKFKASSTLTQAGLDGPARQARYPAAVDAAWDEAAPVDKDVADAVLQDERFAWMFAWVLAVRLGISEDALLDTANRALAAYAARMKRPYSFAPLTVEECRAGLAEFLPSAESYAADLVPDLPSDFRTS